MNKKLFLFFTFVYCLSVSAIENKTILRVELKDGNTNEYVIADRPSISFEEDKVVFVCKKLSTAYAKSEIDKFIFVDESTGIKELESGNTRIDYRVEKEQFIVEGMMGKKQIRVYSINGQEQLVSVNYLDGRMEVTLSSLPTGYYIINISNKQTIKILK